MKDRRSAGCAFKPGRMVAQLLPRVSLAAGLVFSEALVASHPTCNGYGPVNPFEPEDSAALQVRSTDKQVPQSVPDSEREALIAFFNAIGGPKWDVKGSWTVGDPCQNRWPGIKCSDDGAHVVGIEICDIVTEGVLAPELGHLTELRVLRIKEAPFGDGITGGVPAEIGNLTKLEFIRLDWTDLDQPLPASIGNLSALKMLLISQSGLVGPLPTSIGSLPNLRWLRLQTDGEFGPIPVEWAQLQSLEWLDLDGLTGPIPAELSALSNLEHLRLYGTQSGAIPRSLGKLSSLKTLTLGNWSDEEPSGLDGVLPDELGQLVQLERLSVSNTAISGSLPSGFSALGNLQQLDLSDSQFSGPIPEAVRHMTALSILRLGGNNFSGEIPAWIGELSQITNLWLGDNDLSGSLPESLGGLAVLFSLELQNNRLGGHIPGSFSGLVKLQGFRASNNTFSGSIPEFLAELPALEYLHLDRNRLTGPLPVAFAADESIRELYLQGNQLQGEIPVDFIPLLKRRLQCCGFPPEVSTNLAWNALYTADDEVDSRLDENSSADFSATQTVSPANITVTDVGNSHVTLAWGGIEYLAEPGRFRVFYSTSANGDYHDGGATPDKVTLSHTVEGLSPGTAYFFRVRTETDPHVNNANLVISEASPMVSATTSGEPPSVLINAGMSDSWYNPATSGQGFFVNVFPDIQMMFVAWFTYDLERPGEDRPQNLGDAGHRWLTAFGPYAGSRAELNVEITRGGVFNASEPKTTQQLGGSLVIDFFDCMTARVEFHLPDIGQSGEIPIQRLAPDRVPLCESLNAQMK